MSAAPRAGALRTALVRTQRALLTLVPARIRHEYGDDMAQTFADQVDAAMARGRLPGLWAGLAELADLARLVLPAGSRRRVLPPSPGGPRRWLDGLRVDLRHALRRLRSVECGFAIAILAAGTAAMLTVFALLDTALLKPLPYPDGERLMAVGTMREGRAGLGTFSPPMFFDLADSVTALDRMAAAARWTFVINGQGEPEQVRGAYASADLMPLLGASTVLGRGFGPEDHRPGAPATVVLSHLLWQRRFGAGPEVVGTTLQLNDRIFTVVGVASPGVVPPEALHLGGVELWVPMAQFEGGLDAGIFLFEAVGRLAAGATEAEARQQVGAVGARLIAETGMERRLSGVGLLPLRAVTAGDADVPLGMLSGASVALLAIVCANVGGILLSRHERRTRELGVRRAIGASRWRIARLQLLEGAAVGVIGTVLGLPLAALLLRWITEGGVLRLPRLAEATLDLRLLLSAGALAVLVSVAVGMAPAWRWSRIRFAGMSVASGDRGFVARSLNGGLIVVQVALCMALASGAGLLARSLVRMAQVDVGFDGGSLLTFSLSQGSALEAPPMAERAAFFDRVLAGIRRQPGVTGVDLFAGAPSRRTGWSTYLAREVGDAEGEQLDGIGRRIVGPGAIRSLGLRVEHGREFDVTDGPADAPVVLVSEGLARALWSGDDPLGTRVRLGGLGDPDTWWTVVGIVSDARFDGPRRETPLQVYVSALQFAPAGADILVRYEGDLQDVLGGVREAVRQVDPTVPLVGLATMDDLIAGDLEEPGLFAGLLAAFTLLALALTGLGLHAALASAVTCRRREIAVRMVLGAAPGQVTRRVFRQGMSLVALGVIAGAVLSWAGARLLSTFVFGVTTADPVSYLVAASVVLVATGLACWVPGSRAARTDPAVTLRDA